MTRRFFFLLLLSVACLAQTAKVVLDPAETRKWKDKYVKLTESWVQGIEFTTAESAAMEAGKKFEALMHKGPDDPLAKRILSAGEPTYAALAAAYPGKILDRTVLGTYSDPRGPAEGYHDEFSIYWNGAIAANLLKGRLTDNLGATGTLPMAHNTVVEFRVGGNAELFGRVRRNFSSIGYENGYLPVVTATYLLDGVSYKQTAFAHKPKSETAGWDVAFVRFEMTNTTRAQVAAALHTRVILNDGGTAAGKGLRVIDPRGATLLTHNDTKAAMRDATLVHKTSLAPGETRALFFKIPYVPDAKGLVRVADRAGFDSAYKEVRTFWESLLAKGAAIDVPEERVNNAWRALLLQNFVLADGPKFTYGSGLRYNDSTYPQENGFGGHVFAMYGHKEYANALQPWFVGMSVTRQGAGRKYQNRRAMVFHHLLENYRFTGKTELFDRFKTDYFRIADEIVADRQSTMTNTPGERPLSWGLLPPDKPGVDIQASTQTVYVPGHNITNCQGLQDFGKFLVVTGIDKARGAAYMKEAADFRRTILAALRKAAIRLPDRPPFVDLQTLFFRQTPDYGPDPYDDLALGRLQGTYHHYWVDMEYHYNFFNPEDDVGQWLADYVQQRNGFTLGLTRARAQANRQEDWVNNVYDGGYYNYRLRQGRIDEFLLGLYSRFAFGMSRYVYVASEGSPFIYYNTRNGGFVGADYSFPNSAANADTLLMLRNALVLEELKDNIETGTLFLFRGAPRPWFEAGKKIRATRLPTYFGEVSFQTESRGDTIRGEITAPRGDWKQMVISLRHARKHSLRRVMVNGAEHKSFDAQGNVTLTRFDGQTRLEAVFASQ